MQKNIITETPIRKEELPEPFVTVMELAYQHGKIEVLEALTNLIKFESQNPDASANEREVDEILHVDLSRALEQYLLFFGYYSGPEAQINHGVVMV